MGSLGNKVFIMILGSVQIWPHIRKGTLHEILPTIPREEWGVVIDGKDLLKNACSGPNLKAVKMLVSAGVDVNATEPIVIAIQQSYEIVEYLIAAGANIQLVIENIAGYDGYGINPGSLLDFAISQRRFDSASVLIANGLRLRSDCSSRILVSFEQHILKLRRIIVALIGMKRLAKLDRWDKFLLKEIAWAVWATKYSF